MLSLPDAALEGLAGVLNHVQEILAFPLQILLNIIALTPKFAGGDRPIILAALLYACWCVVREPVLANWDLGFETFWDDAVKGGSCLQVALQRRLLDELSCLKGGFNAGSL